MKITQISQKNSCFSIVLVVNKSETKALFIEFKKSSKESSSVFNQLFQEFN